MNRVSTPSGTASDRSLTTAGKIARGLGWFSLGLGLVELVAPGKVGRALGLEGRETLLRAYGGREIGAGMLALTDKAAPAIWSRVAGDLLDLGTLAAAFRSADEEQRRNAAIAIAAVAAVALVDLVTAISLTAGDAEEEGRAAGHDDRSGVREAGEQARGAAPREVPVAAELTPA